MRAPSHSQDAVAPLKSKPWRWRYAYFLLAAFDLVTVCAGLYLNHRIMRIYTESVGVNRVWAERVANYSHLGELAADVDRPGNDVFDSRDVANESARMRAAEKIFDRALANQRQELETHLEPPVAGPLLAKFDVIELAKSKMVAEAERIFDYFQKGRPDLAGERMATMDQRYADLNTALLELRRTVGAIQDKNFKEQTAAAGHIQKFEYLIGLLIVCMVLGATFYGHLIARQMQSDAEERERFVRALQEAEARTRGIVDTAAEGIVSFDQHGRIQAFNKAAEKLFALSAGEAIGLGIHSLIPGLTESLESKPSAKDAGPCLFGGDSVGQRRDGTRFPLEFSVSKLSAGTVPIFTAIIRDLTDRRKAQEALRVAEAAQAANRAKSQFLANMSHEIRTPMNGVLGMTEMLLDSELAPAQRRLAETVQRSGESLLEIIDRILDFSKIEAGKLELECIDFNPRELADEVMQLMAEGARKKGLKLVCRVASDVPEMAGGAPSGLRQVMTNLVGNAIKFTDHGSVALEVSVLGAGAREPSASVTATRHLSEGATLLHVSVADTGIGIEESVQAQLFQAFTQADSSTTRRYGGTGLGLAISKELVEQMGGRIGVRSTPGEGSRFWFTVRLDPALQHGHAPRPVSIDRNTVAALSGVRVLLVEDNAVNQDVARAMLESLDCEVAVAENGIEALAALERGRFDAVLMDLQMSEMDGFAATAKIRSRRMLRPRQPRATAEPVRLPIIGLTASALKGDREICIAAGMDDYLTKPFRREALRQMLERWVFDSGRAGVEAPPIPSRPGAAERQRGRVMIVDDSAGIRDCFTQMLEDAGFEVEAAADGHAALAACLARPPDVVVTDVSMPGLDGLALISRLRADPCTAGIAVLLLSGRADEDSRRQGLAAAADGYLVKPVSRRELVARVERAVQQARARQQLA